jgi:ribose-phosphate pyrophosphokinase
MYKALVKAVPDIALDKDVLIIIYPDEGAMDRSMYYSSVIGVDIGMFYKRRDYSKIVNGRNPIVAHEYLGPDLTGKDVIIADDMISSGDSLIDVAYQLKEKGVKRVFAFATFGLFTDGPDKFTKAHKDGIIDKVFTTNLVYVRPDVLSCDWYVGVNMCKYVSYIIDTLNHDETISELLNPVKRINTLVEKHRAESASQIKIDI